MVASEPFARLLAKSSPTPDSPARAATLSGHLVDVAEVAQEIAGSWGTRALSTLGLPTERWGERLRLALPRAAFLHDIGKANDHFQRMLRDRISRQACRHEAVSLWLVVAKEELRQWLLDGCDEIVGYAILSAAAGHHLKLEGPSSLTPREGSGRFTLTVLAGHADFAAALDEGAGIFELSSPPRLADYTLDLDDQPLQAARQWLLRAHSWWNACGDRDTRVFVALVKALVIGADVVGSAVPRRTGEAAVDWARRSLSHVCTSGDLEHVVRESLRASDPPSEPRPLRPFQGSMAQSAARVTFVRAGCGSGKTTGAYAWAARHAPGRKLFFCYPTTGTTTEGFRGYAHGTIDAALVHSRAQVDLAEILGNGRDDEAETHADRLAGLESWDAKVSVATVDSVLGLVQNKRRGLFTSPALLNGAFVFDEIHQYDPSLFAALEQFLRTFRGAPVLLMTASLPQARLQRLQSLLAESGEELHVLDGPADLETIPRYVVASAEHEEACRRVKSTLQAGGRVLWVSNTVDRCRSIAQQEWGQSDVLTYHSRYRYEDRVQRHADVVRAFAPGATRAALAVATQVCEVSLDISADLLVTDLAPVPALIQRLGRLNRWVNAKHPGTPADALVLEVDSPLPYMPGELECARRWLARVSGRAVSQDDLAGAFVALEEADTEEGIRASAWLEGGPFAAVGPLREQGTTVSVVRTEDIPLEPASDDWVRNSIPMPLQPVLKELGSWPRHGVTFVAPAGRVKYDSTLGAEWL